MPSQPVPLFWWLKVSKAVVSNGPERLIFMAQREPDGALSWGSEILDEGYVGLPEFTAGIRPAG